MDRINFSLHMIHILGISQHVENRVMLVSVSGLGKAKKEISDKF